MPQFSPVSLERLRTCDVRLQSVLRETINYIDFVILEGHRNKEAQNKAFEEGKSQKQWPDGKHNKLPSLAVDIWPYVPEVKVVWQDVISAARLMGYIQRVAQERGIKLRFGLDWDGDFRTAGIDPDEKFLDAPHVELVL